MASTLQIVILIAISLMQCAAAQKALGQDERETTPSTPQELTDEATAAIRNKNYDQAITLLRKAISLNPNDVGVTFDPWSFSSYDCNIAVKDGNNVDRIRQQLISEYSDRHRGRSELRKMLADRPAMAIYLSPSDDLWEWSVRKFGKRIDGGLIKWDGSEPNADWRAQSIGPQGGFDGRIYVRNITPRVHHFQSVFEKLWFPAVFELYNVENTYERQKLYDRAKKGSITETEFVKAMYILEWETIERIRKWYVEIFLLHAKKYELRSNPAIWYFNSWGSPQDRFEQYTDKSLYPWNPYLLYFRQAKSNSSAQ